MDIIRDPIGGSPIFASDFVFCKQPSWNDEIEAIYKVLIWLILPDDIFFYCFCKPLLNDEVHEVRSKIEENDLISEWLTERKTDEQSLDAYILSEIEISPIDEDLSHWLRLKLGIEADIDMMKDYTKFSAFNFGDIGLLQN